MASCATQLQCWSSNPCSLAQVLHQREPTADSSTVSLHRRISRIHQSEIFNSFGCTLSAVVAPSASQQQRSWRQLSLVPRASASQSALPPCRLAVFVSGGGSNFKSIHAAIQDGRINGQVVVVVSDKPECGGCAYAKSHGIPVLAYPRSNKFAPEGLDPVALVDKLGSLGVEYVLLAGYLKLLPEELVAAFPRAILNIHPALLPAFGGKGYYGMRVHEAVVRSGARVSGPTIHFVDEEFDHGPILAQRTVPVYHTDTPKDVQERVLKEEHIIYPEAVAALCARRVQWRDDGIPYVVEEASVAPAGSVATASAV